MTYEHDNTSRPTVWAINVDDVIENIYDLVRGYYELVSNGLSETILLTQVLTNTFAWVGEVVFRSMLRINRMSQLLQIRIKNTDWRLVISGSSWYGRMLISRVSVAQLD